jgi:hypothetical protein
MSQKHLKLEISIPLERERSRDEQISPLWRLPKGLDKKQFVACKAFEALKDNLKGGAAVQIKILN